MWILKVLAFLWPFIKEMVLGDKTLKEAIKDNKKKVLLALLIMVSVGMNFFTISRLVVVSQNYINVEKKYLTAIKPATDHPAIVEKHKGGKPIPVPPPAVPTQTTTPVPVVAIENKPITTKPVIPKTTTKPKKKVGPSNVDRYSKMKDDFDKIKEREDKAGL